MHSRERINEVVAINGQAGLMIPMSQEKMRAFGRSQVVEVLKAVAVVGEVGTRSASSSCCSIAACSKVFQYEAQEWLLEALVWQLLFCLYCFVLVMEGLQASE